MASKFFKGILLGALALQLMAPAFAFAEDGKGAPKNGQRPEAGTQFCARLATFGSKVDGDMYNREVKLRAEREEHSSKMGDKWHTRDTMRTNDRTQRNENIQARFDKIGSGDLTDAQKTALAAFISIYKQAVATREAAVDAAVKTYRDGVTNVMASHQSSMDSILGAFKASVKAAEEKASADCSSGVAMKTVRTTLIASIESAKDTLRAARKELDDRDEGIKPLIDARNQAVQAALEAFKASIAKARDDLQAAFPGTKK